MKKILLVDDDDGFREALKDSLKDMGYFVFEASNGLQGLKMLENTTIDLLISDIVMPEEDGIGLLIKTKHLNPKLKIIMISGGGKMVDDKYLHGSKLLGADGVLKKPFSGEQIHSLIEQLFQ